MPGPAIASHRNRARYSNSSNPSSVSSESTSAHLAARMATIMVTPSAPAEMRVNSPSSRNMPPKNSMPEVSGVKKCGKGIPQPMKFSVTCGRLLSLPQPLNRKTQPTVIRANSGASHMRCLATRSGHAISQSISCRITWFSCFGCLQIDPMRNRNITVIGVFYLLGRRLRRRFFSQQIHCRLVQLGAQQKALIGARDIADGDFHAAGDRFDVDARCAGEHLVALRRNRALPLEFGFAGTLGGDCGHLFGDGIHNRIGVTAQGYDHLQLVP